jgi:hypothetical protein
MLRLSTIGPYHVRKVNLEWIGSTEDQLDQKSKQRWQIKWKRLIYDCLQIFQPGRDNHSNKREIALRPAVKAL